MPCVCVCSYVHVYMCVEAKSPSHLLRYTLSLAWNLLVSPRDLPIFTFFLLMGSQICVAMPAFLPWLLGVRCRSSCCRASALPTEHLCSVMSVFVLSTEFCAVMVYILLSAIERERMDDGWMDG